MLVKQDDSLFKPLIITLECQEEVNALFAVFNHISISEAICMTDHYLKFKDCYTNDYLTYHNNLEQLIRKGTLK